MVIPEGTERQPAKKSASKATVVLLTAFTGAIALIGFSALTQPDPEAAPSSTTSTTAEKIARPIDLENFDVGQIAQGETYRWKSGQVISDVTDSRLVVNGEDVYLFVSEVFPKSGTLISEPGRVFKQGSNSVWDEIGSLPADLPASTIASTPDGFAGVANGYSGEPARLMTSNDGVHWTSEILPEVSDSPLAVTWGRQPAITESAAVVVLGADVDFTSVVADHYTEVFGAEPNLDYFWPGTEFDGVTTKIVLNGPYGFNMWEFPASDIGLTNEDLGFFDQGRNLSVFGRESDGTWNEAGLEVGWVESLAPRPDGGISVFGWPQNGGQVGWLSYDGLTWESESNPTIPYQGVAFGGGMAGVDNNRSSRLAVSTDGFEWEPVLQGIFPIQFGWWVSYLAGGDGGVAAVLEGWDQSQHSPALPRPTLTMGDTTLTLDFSRSVVEIVTPTTTVDYDMWTDQADQNYSVDLTEGTISFLQPDTGIVHMTVPIIDLFELESGTYFEPYETRHMAFVHSRDGEEWSIADLGIHLPEDTNIAGLALSETEIFLVTTNTADVVFGRTGRRSDIQIWTAPLP